MTLADDISHAILLACPAFVPTTGSASSHLIPETVEEKKHFYLCPALVKLLFRHEPRFLTPAVGVIRAVSTGNSKVEHQTTLCNCPCKILVKVAFATKNHPAHVTIGCTKIPVLPYIVKLPKCFKCSKFGHVQGDSNKGVRCTRCRNSL